MSIEIRAPEEADVPAMFAADARGFGGYYEDEEIERRLPIIDLSRFRIAVDGAAIVGVAGSFALDMTVPGGATVPMGGVTWVSVAATHRRQGILRRLLGAVHADIDDRDEPVAGLSASEGGIYGRFGYGIATEMRRIAIDARSVQLREELVPKPGSVRFMETDEARVHVPMIWDRAGASGRARRPAPRAGGAWCSPTRPSPRTASHPPCVFVTTTATRRTASGWTGTRAVPPIRSTSSSWWR
jgi:GNAT superfamily N-acetyltransferase